MSEHASFRCYGERDDRKGAVQQRISWHQWLLVCMAVAFTVCSPLPGEAVNGEPVGAEGLYRTGACSSPDFANFTIGCDDRSQAGVVSCHMRRQAVAPALAKDEGLAINTCVDGRITTGTAQSLETDVAIRATDFGEFVCGKESDGSDFCVVCDTFKDPEASIGASHCVKISNEDLPEPSTCGAFTVSRDQTGLCLSTTQDLKRFFSDPRLGFMIGFNGSDAGDPGAKDLLICGSRSWQCIDNRTSEFALAAGQVQQQQTHALIDTPCCLRLASGAYYCSTKLTTSATCR